jgi:hypothetical protein
MKGKLAMLAIACLVAGCEASVGPDSEQANGGLQRESEPGKVSLEAPGVDVKVDIPSIEKFADIEAQSDSDLLYPGSKLDGLHVEARDKDGRVDLRFTSRDSPELVAAWYRDPGRAPHFSIDSASRDGAAVVMRGRDKDGNDSFQLRLEPSPAGGTAGRLILTDV